MLHLDWSEEYSIGSAAVDAEHQHLLEMANKIFAMIHPAANRQELISLVKELFRYAETHFANEEAYMEEIGFPELDRHRKLHQLIVREMTGALKGIDNLETYAESLKEMMVEWVVQHIIQEDTKIGKHVQSLQTATAEEA